MAKNTTAANAEVTGFLAQLGTFATAITDLSEVVVKRDPVINARTKFATNCDETIKLISQAADQGKFFKKIADGFLITFRNGNSAMQLNGTQHFKVANTEAAIKFIEAAKAAAANGELDQAFRDTMRASRKAKDQATV
jgi:hypothetical protein